MIISSRPKKNKHGRVGVRRQRPTTNQALKAELSLIETKHRAEATRLKKKIDNSVPEAKLAAAISCIETAREMTSKSRTGVAHKINELVTGFIEAFE